MDLNKREWGDMLMFGVLQIEREIVPDLLGASQMAHNFDSSLDFGDNRPLTGFRSLKHPFVVLSHIVFRGFAIFFYIFANLFSSSFIVQFLILLSLFSADFWTVKNITGRLLVGLRWWNFVDAEGKNHWKFESSKNVEMYDAMERRIFWGWSALNTFLGALFVAPFFWLLLVSVAFLTFQWQWMVIGLLGLVMGLANLYGYVRCKWSSTQELTNYVTKWAFLSMLTRSSQQEQQQTVNLETV